jgi:hypothetical protein
LLLDFKFYIYKYLLQSSFCIGAKFGLLCNKIASMYCWGTDYIIDWDTTYFILFTWCSCLIVGRRVRWVKHIQSCWKNREWMCDYKKISCDYADWIHVAQNNFLCLAFLFLEPYGTHNRSMTDSFIFCGNHKLTPKLVVVEDGNKLK